MNKALLDLGEHFDNVQIFASRHEEDTDFVARGRGNFFARIGQVREWLVKQEEESRREVWKNHEDI